MKRRKKDRVPQKGQNNSGRTHDIRAGNSNTIARATLIAMIGMLLAKVTGFLREMLIVPLFGYGIYSDAYYHAFQIPDLFYELLVGGAVAAVLTPTLSSGIERHQEEKTWRSVSIFMSFMVCAMGILILVGEVSAPWLIHMISGSGRADAGEDLRKTAELAYPVMRILFLQTFMMMLVSLSNGVLNAYKRFGPSSMGVPIYNITYMFALIFLAGASPVGLRNLAWGVVGAALLYFLFQAFSARRELRYFRFSLDLDDPAFQRLFKLAIPTLISGSVLHLNGIVMNRFASGLEELGAVSSIRQCTTTWGLPYSVFAVAIGNVMLPNLSGFVAGKNAEKVRSLFTKSLRSALYMILPFALFFAVFNKQTIQLIFQWNAESYANAQVASTGHLLRWFCISMVMQTVVFLCNQAFYARRITRLALFTGLLTLAFNPLFCLLFIEVLGFGLEGIGMAHALYSSLSAFILLTVYRKHKAEYAPYRLFPFFLRLAVIGLATGFVFLAMRAIPLEPTIKFWQIFVYGIRFVAGMTIYYIAGLAIGLREAKDLQKKLRSLVGLPSIKQEAFDA